MCIFGIELGSSRPKGPQGQGRPACGINAAVLVVKIATDEVEDTRSSGRRNSGLAGAKARAEALTAAERSKIAEASAKARWSKEMDTSSNKMTSAEDCVVLMYPDNQLGEPVRSYEDSLNVGDVLQETFFSNQD